MRAAPAFQIFLPRSGAWRCAVSALCALGLLVVGAWLLTREAPLSSPSSCLVALGSLLAAGSGVSLARTPASNLRWDGRAWHLGTAAGESTPGDLSVEIDLGGWMLLRFRSVSPGSRARVDWLPVQRRGIESAWHGLRCSVYSPRPASLADDPPPGF